MLGGQKSIKVGSGRNEATRFDKRSTDMDVYFRGTSIEELSHCAASPANASVEGGVRQMGFVHIIARSKARSADTTVLEKWD